MASSAIRALSGIVCGGPRRRPSALRPTAWSALPYYIRARSVPIAAFRNQHQECATIAIRPADTMGHGTSAHAGTGNGGAIFCFPHGPLAWPARQTGYPAALAAAVGKTSRPLYED